jgi:hypothetical protein
MYNLFRLYEIHIELLAMQPCVSSGIRVRDEWQHYVRAEDTVM